MKKAVVLLSGGMDSATTAAIASSEGYELYAISFDYGQRHSKELESAKAVAKNLGAADHLIVSFDLRAMGGSALTDEIDVPMDTGVESRKSKVESRTVADLQSEISNLRSEIPVTYVPASTGVESRKSKVESRTVAGFQSDIANLNSGIPVTYVPASTGVESRKSKVESKTVAGFQSDIADLKSEIPVTYVPARNTIFLAFALGYAETLGAFDIFIGVSQVDYSGYPDCRAEFLAAFERTANLATKAGVEGAGAFRIHAPLIDWSKSQTILRGLELGVDYSLTWSCYLGGEMACGRCDSCKLRLAGFAEAGAIDPLEYA